MRTSGRQQVVAEQQASLEQDVQPGRESATVTPSISTRTCRELARMSTPLAAGLLGCM